MVESSLDGKQNRLLLHIAPFKLFFNLVSPAPSTSQRVFSWENNQALNKQRQTAPNSLRELYTACVSLYWCVEVGLDVME